MGNKWESRRGFVGGRSATLCSASTPVTGTSEAALYRPAFVQMSGFTQNLPAGSYRVTLKMRECWWSSAGQRVFSVNAEGARALSDIDIVKAVGRHRAYDRSFDVRVTDGRLDLGFTASKDTALVTALEIVPLPTSTATTYRMTVNAQATSAADGTVYSPRAGFEGGRSGSTRASTDIKGTPDDALYAPEWVLAHAWRKSVANGTYDVTLKMREAYFTAPGQRVFSVDAENQRVLTDVDVFKAVGRNAAYDRTFRVRVDDGQLDLTFPATRDGATISALVVTPVNVATSPPSTPTPPPTEPVPRGVTGSWKSAFRDEFDGGALNTSVWTPHRGLPPYTYASPFNPSLDNHAYDPSRVAVKDGHLRLSWDRAPITAGNKTYPYTAGVAHTGKGYSFTHGFVAARIWVPDEAGLWSAFWMLSTPVDQAWPPEIDIAEIVPDNSPDGLYKPHFNYHWKDASGAHKQFGWKAYGVQGKSYAGSWHTYGLLWEPGKLQSFIDGNPGPSYSGPEVWNKPMYVVLNSAVKKGYNPPNGVMLVDYLRVWQRS